MRAVVLRVGGTATVTVKPGEGVKRAGLQRAAQHIQSIHRINILGLRRVIRSSSKSGVANGDTTGKTHMQDDERCCGTGTCLIDATGRCWCGQQWDGEKMCRPTDAPGAAETPLSAMQMPTTPANPQ
jgi:hypothetical protein